MICFRNMEYCVTSRIESIRVLVNEMLQTMDSSVEKSNACVYLYGVSTFASMLAMKRGQNSELAAIAGLLHHYYFYKTGIAEFPGPNSSEAVRPLIRDIKIFSNEERMIILQAIFYQDDRKQIHGPYEEIIKDAIVLQMFFQTTGSQTYHLDAHRLQNVLDELAIPCEFEVSRIDKASIPEDTGDRRRKLADISEALAGKNIIGIPGDEQYREICMYWPDTGIYKILRGSWCAAFVYHCCRQAGILLPIRYPNGIYRFAGVGAWLEWARLPETGFFHIDGQEGFSPQRGDIVIYEKLLSENSHDHIGIILACDEKEILVAEGNRDNMNYSSVFRRKRYHCILGYIRIDNDYQFNFNGYLQSDFLVE
ncbi:CHAP domain-containing protein [Paenibacillus azoreducens]|uniref:Peptidase C51 domain-containing protein n=1 Tax=Paenibacillus azoreducens TaxID=116718 RepID=A0A919YDC0_9BACL|nr:CHAP domain-containing protein [Paenibacillus azoreducens]GIO48649.1 hypothetical protein J34TS1_34140 [Paenibacillus azoreducens]